MADKLAVQEVLGRLNQIYNQNREAEETTDALAAKGSEVQQPYGTPFTGELFIAANSMKEVVPSLQKLGVPEAVCKRVLEAAATLKKVATEPDEGPQPNINKIAMDRTNAISSANLAIQAAADSVKKLSNVH